MQINSFKSHFIPNICMHLRIEYVVFRKEKIKFTRIYCKYYRKIILYIISSTDTMYKSIIECKIIYKYNEMFDPL